MDLLRNALTEYFQQDRVHGWLRLPPEAGRLRARLFDLGAVMSERIDEQGDWMIEVELQRRRLLQLQHSEGLPELA
jgi:GTP-binding protein HflX